MLRPGLSCHELCYAATCTALRNATLRNDVLPYYLQCAALLPALRCTVLCQTTTCVLLCWLSCNALYYNLL